MRTTDDDNVITGVFGKGRFGEQTCLNKAAEPEWVDLKKNGEADAKSIANVRVFLAYMGVKLWLNQFENRIRMDGSEEYQILDDHALFWLWGQANDLKFKPSPGFMKNAFKSIAGGNARHPLRDWLKSLKWDGDARIDRLFIDYAGAEDNPINRAIGKLLLVAMVRRIFQPGCKYDYMVILQGQQGCEKSLFCQTLAGGPDFFEENLTLAADPQKVIENSSGKWVVEISELSGMDAKEVEHQKALITRAVDRARQAYGHFTTTAPRQFVLIGTTNYEVFLRDMTGNRRYLPVRVSNINSEALRGVRDQLFAEACEVEKMYGPLIMPPKLKEELLLRQSKFTVIDPSLERLSDYISEKLSMDSKYAFPKDELFGVMGVTKPTSKDGKLLTQVARQHGLTEVKRGPKEKRIRYFVPQAEAQDS